MDKLKIVLDLLKKHHFWLLCGISVLIGLPVWSLATADLSSRFDQRKTKINSAFSSVASIRTVSPHPNERVIEEIKKKKEVAAQAVFDAWDRLYKQQVLNNKIPASLGPEFEKSFGALLKPGDEIPETYRTYYQAFIGEHFPTLFKSLRVRGLGSGTAAGGAGTPPLAQPAPLGGNLAPGDSRSAAAGAADQPEEEGIVEWDGTDRQRIRDRFDFPTVPTTQEVVLAQEDLWVYEALIGVIKNVNKNATSADDAAVQRIESMEIGEDAISDRASAPGVSGEGTGGAGRYVGDQGQPLPKPVPPAEYDHPFDEFKMMPIRLKLQVEQKEIPKLLAECANSTMPIEVTQLSIGSGTALDLSQLATAGEARSAPTDTAPKQNAKKLDSSVVPVVIEGIICIYNPSDRQKLGTGATAAGGSQTTSQEAEAATTSKAGPAQTPPADSGS